MILFYFLVGNSQESYFINRKLRNGVVEFKYEIIILQKKLYLIGIVLFKFIYFISINYNKETGSIDR